MVVVEEIVVLGVVVVVLGSVVVVAAATGGELEVAGSRLEVEGEQEGTTARTTSSRPRRMVSTITLAPWMTWR
ncbi:MAG TPA: hypothetical protein VFT54_01970 [Acidimicrobiia bacterium]|nr:hypothetical protein [Acidimicrobiia bacterium]